MRHVGWGLLLGLVLGLFTCSSQAAAEDAGGCVRAGWDAVSADCYWSWGDYESSSSGDGSVTWRVLLKPDNGGIRADELTCNEDGVPGFWHDVYRNGVDVGDVCVPEARVVDVAKLAVRAFRRLEWPPSEVVVQPPGGRTLVNLETIFFTANSQPTVRTVTLVGREVQVEATPVSYDWDFGDGAGETTSSAGAAYPDHDVFHVYSSTGRVVARVATTYAGRFRVGGGAWQSIDETATVAGRPVGLEIVEARPQLVVR